MQINKKGDSHFQSSCISVIGLPPSHEFHLIIWPQGHFERCSRSFGEKQSPINTWTLNEQLSSAHYASSADSWNEPSEEAEDHLMIPQTEMRQIQRDHGSRSTRVIFPEGPWMCPHLKLIMNDGWWIPALPYRYNGKWWLVLQQGLTSPKGQYSREGTLQTVMKLMNIIATLSRSMTWLLWHLQIHPGWNYDNYPYDYIPLNIPPSEFPPTFDDDLSTMLGHKPQNHATVN